MEHQEQQEADHYASILQLQLYLEGIARRGGDTDTDAGIEWGWQVNEVVGKVVGSVGGVGGGGGVLRRGGERGAGGRRDQRRGKGKGRGRGRRNEGKQERVPREH